MKKTLALSFFAVLISFSSIASFAYEYKILAVVNGESVSTTQVKDRVGLVMSSAGMKDSIQNRNKLTSEIVEILINEVLQKQDADEKGLVISPSEMTGLIADLEKKNNIKAGTFKEFITAKGLSYDSILSQIQASVIWRKIIQRNVRPQITVTEKEIKAAQAEIDAEKNKPQPAAKTFVNISEIIVPVEFGKETEAKELANTIVRTARSKAKDFGDLALQYSVGKTGPKKGLVGWLPQEGMLKQIAEKVKATKVGGIADPISIQSMFVIIKVNDRKVEELAKPQFQDPKEKVIAEKMDDGAKKYIKQLRDKAYIDRKYKTEDLINFVW
jgi:peptidyl-prolyl cis-trans isomerase SurA